MGGQLENYGKYKSFNAMEIGNYECFEQDITNITKLGMMRCCARGREYTAYLLTTIISYIRLTVCNVCGIFIIITKALNRVSITDSTDRKEREKWL